MVMVMAHRGEEGLHPCIEMRGVARPLHETSQSNHTEVEPRACEDDVILNSKFT